MPASRSSGEQHAVVIRSPRSAATAAGRSSVPQRTSQQRQQARRRLAHLGAIRPSSSASRRRSTSQPNGFAATQGRTPSGTIASGYRIGVRYMRIVSSGARTCSTSRTNTCSAASASATPGYAEGQDRPHRDREQQPLEADRLAEREEHDQHDEIAGEAAARTSPRPTRRRRSRAGTRPCGSTRRRPGSRQSPRVSAFLRGEPGPQRHGDEEQKARAAERARAEHRREDEVVDGEQQQRLQERPQEARSCCRDSG